MPMFRLFLSIPIILAACLKDETVSGYADPETTYFLQELNGKNFRARATITFPEAGSIQGSGPCNRYAADQNAPYPWLQLGPIAATRAACADLPKEKQFFEALAGMTEIEAFDDLIILRNEAGGEMIFRAR